MQIYITWHWIISRLTKTVGLTCPSIFTCELVLYESVNGVKYRNSLKCMLDLNVLKFPWQ